MVTIVMKNGQWNFENTTIATGADLLFDYIADGRTRLHLDVRSSPFEDATELNYMGMAEDHLSGAYYYIEHYRGTRVDLVVFFTDEFLFIPELTLPKTIYIKKINT